VVAVASPAPCSFMIENSSTMVLTMASACVRELEEGALIDVVARHV
jgi:hypothetical protein